MARLLALEKPIFSWFEISFTQGNFVDTMGTDPSEEWLSTTQTSAEIPFIAF
jgi:hypothetical protein